MDMTTAYQYAQINCNKDVPPQLREAFKALENAARSSDGSLFAKQFLKEDRRRHGYASFEFKIPEMNSPVSFSDSLKVIKAKSGLCTSFQECSFSSRMDESLEINNMKKLLSSLRQSLTDHQNYTSLEILKNLRAVQSVMSGDGYNDTSYMENVYKAGQEIFDENEQKNAVNMLATLAMVRSVFLRLISLQFEAATLLANYYSQMETVEQELVVTSIFNMVKQLNEQDPAGWPCFQTSVFRARFGGAICALAYNYALSESACEFATKPTRHCGKMDYKRARDHLYKVLDPLNEAAVVSHIDSAVRGGINGAIFERRFRKGTRTQDDQQLIDLEWTICQEEINALKRTFVGESNAEVIKGLVHSIGRHFANTCVGNSDLAATDMEQFRVWVSKITVTIEPLSQKHYERSMVKNASRTQKAVGLALVGSALAIAAFAPLRPGRRGV